MFSPFFVDNSPFAGAPRYGKSGRQVPFFLDNDEEDEWSPFDLHPLPRRAASQHPRPVQQRMPHQSPQNANRSRVPVHGNRIPIQPQHQQSCSRPQQKPRHIDLALANESAQSIQRVWRGYQVRKIQLIQKLKQLKKINDAFMFARLKFHHLRDTVENLSKQETSSAELNMLPHFHKQLLCLEEELTKSLISLDAISSGQSQLIRLQRKSIVDGINAVLQAVEPLKKSAGNKLKEIQAYRTQQEEQNLRPVLEVSNPEESSMNVESSSDAPSTSTVHSSETSLADNSKADVPILTEEQPQMLAQELPGNPYMESDTELYQEKEPQKEEQPQQPLLPQEEISEPHRTEVEHSQENAPVDVPESDFVMIGEPVEPIVSSESSYDDLKLLVEKQSHMLLEKDKIIKQLEAKILQLESGHAANQQDW